MASGTVQSGLIAKVQINNDTAQSIASTAYGICSTAANEAAKVVQIDGFELITGVTIHVKFTNDNTASNPPTLNVNGTGAVYIVQYNNVAIGVASETSGWQAGAVLSLTYDGTYWVRDQGYNTNTTYSVVNTSAAGLVPQANTVSTQSQSTKFLREDGSWAAPSYTTNTDHYDWDDITNKPTTISGYGITDAASSTHVHGNIANDGTITSGNGNRLIYTDVNTLIGESGHYVSSTKVAINSTSEPTENLYVSGKLQFNIGTSDESSSKNFIVYGNNEFLSIGGQGLQAYSGATSSTTVNTLYLQSNGGNLIVGASNNSSATRTMYGDFDFKNKFTYSGIATAASADIYRPLWIMGASSTPTLTTGLPEYNTDLAYNTSTGTLKIGGSGTISATDYNGTAAKATADASGNTITTTYAPINSPTFTGTPLITTTPDNGDNSHKIADTAFVMNTLSYADAMIFKGTIGAGGTINTTADPAQTLPDTHEAGWTYKVITDGTYAGLSCIAGDLIICMADGTVASNADWTRVGTNATGSMTGPASATDNAIARFDGATGAVIQDSNITINDDGLILAAHNQDSTDGMHFTYGSNISFFTGIGSDNTNYGIYDTKASKWILSATASNHNWTFDGNASTATAWASAQTTYVNLASSGTDSTLNGGQSSAQVLKVNGVLGISNGGTGSSTTPTLGGIIYAGDSNGNTVYACTGAGTTGQLLISNGSSAPSWYSGLTLSGIDSTSYAANFGGTVTATTFCGAIDNTAENASIERNVWFNRVSNSTEQMGQLGYDSDFTYNPSTNTLKIGKLTFGSTDTYGSAYEPIYWNAGIPTAAPPVQYFTWTISSGNYGVTMTGTNIFNTTTLGVTLVITSGQQYLNAPLSWTSAADTFTISTTVPTTGAISGYAIVSRSTDISGSITATQIEPANEEDPEEEEST